MSAKHYIMTKGLKTRLDPVCAYCGKPIEIGQATVSRKIGRTWAKQYHEECWREHVNVDAYGEPMQKG